MFCFVFLAYCVVWCGVQYTGSRLLTLCVLFVRARNCNMWTIQISGLTFQILDVRVPGLVRVSPSNEMFTIEVAAEHKTLLLCTFRLDLLYRSWCLIPNSFLYLMFLTFCLHQLVKVSHICASNREKEISRCQNNGSKRHFVMKADENVTAMIKL